MKEQFKAIEVITKGIEGLSRDDKHRVLNFVQSGVGYADSPQPIASVDEPIEDAPKPAAKPKAASKAKAPAKPKAEPVTQKQVLEALRAYAEKKDDKEMAMQVLNDVSGAKKLADVDKKFYAKLVKALAV